MWVSRNDADIQMIYGDFQFFFGFFCDFQVRQVKNLAWCKCQIKSNICLLHQRKKNKQKLSQSMQYVATSIISK